MNWQDVATALWLAENDTERQIAGDMYRAQLRMQLYGPQPGPELAGLMANGAHGTLVARAAGPIAQDQAVVWERPPVVQAAMDAVDAAAQAAAEGLRPGHPAHSDGPTEGQIRSNAAGDGVEQYRAGIWQEVDPVDLFKHQKALIDAQRGPAAPEPPVDPALLPPVIRPVPDPGTAYRHEVLLQQRRAGSAQNSAVRPASAPVAVPEGPGVGESTPTGGHAAQADSAGDVNVHVKATPSACGATTPDGPCGLAPHHPVGPMFPGYNGHLHTGD